MKFKIGDVVKYIGRWDSYDPYELLVVIDIDDSNEDPVLPYCVINRKRVTCWVKEDALELIENTESEKENNKMKVFESNCDKTLGNLFPGDYFKFMSEKLKGCYGIVCDYSPNAIDYIDFREELEDKVFCMIFSDAIPYPTFSIEDASIEVKKIPGKTIFEED